MDEPGDGPHARTPRIEDVARVCAALNREGARYVLIGGFAVVMHGAVRTTKDIDLLVDDSAENVDRLKRALSVLEDKAALEIRDSDVKEYTVVRVADEIVVDLMGRACGLSYADAILDAESFDVDSVSIQVASKPTLIRTKDTLRPSDAADRAFLRARIEAETSE